MTQLFCKPNKGKYKGIKFNQPIKDNTIKVYKEPQDKQNTDNFICVYQDGEENSIHATYENAVERARNIVETTSEEEILIYMLIKRVKEIVKKETSIIIEDV